jgi:hypothetical protein
MALQGHDPGALRHTATGLKYSGAALTGVATLYQSLAEHAKVMAAAAGAKAAALAIAPPLPQNEAVRNDHLRSMREFKEQSERLAAKAKSFQQVAGSMLTAANALEGTAAAQTSASSASGFLPPMVDIPDGSGSGPLDPSRGGDPTVDPSGGEPYGLPFTGGGGPVGPGGGLPSGGGPGDPGTTVLPSLALGGAIGEASADGLRTGLDALREQEATAAGPSADGRDIRTDGPLGLLPGGSAAAGLALAAVAGVGIAAGVLRASRRAAKRQPDGWEDEDRGDDVEAVYQAGPGQRPAAG